jgi:hypothetical protein
VAMLGGAIRRSVALDEELLGVLEGDRRWYTGQLLLVVGVAAMATISMTTALAMTTGNPALGWPLIFGLGLGLFVGVCDLTIVLPDGQTHGRTPWSYAGRLVFSIVMGGLAAMPLTAAILARDVDHHEEQVRQQQITTAAGVFEQQVTDTRAAVHLAHLPAIEAAAAARDAARRQADDARTADAAQRSECNNEINGAGSGIPGEGPRAGAKCAAADQLANRVNDSQRRADEADAALAAAMQAEMTDADQRVAGLEDPAVVPYQPSELGVIDRITRTHDRLGTPGTIAVTLALMALDTLPVILKLAHGPTTYERVLARRQQTEAARLLTPAQGEDVAVALLLETEAGAGEPIADDELERFIHARLIVDPNIQAKDLHAAARARGYDRSYPTFTRFLRDRALRPTATRQRGR